jgi:hypothetical protein
MSTFKSYQEASPEMRRALINDGLLHAVASLKRLSTELSKLNAWLNTYSADNETGRVEDMNPTVLHHFTETFGHNADELTNQIIATSIHLNDVKDHISKKAIKSLNQ